MSKLPPFMLLFYISEMAKQSANYFILAALAFGKITHIVSSVFSFAKVNEHVPGQVDLPLVFSEMWVGSWLVLSYPTLPHYQRHVSLSMLLWERTNYKVIIAVY